MTFHRKYLFSSPKVVRICLMTVSFGIGWSITLEHVQHNIKKEGRRKGMKKNILEEDYKKV